MTRTNFKPVYADNNPEWRLRYMCNGMWELQEWRSLPEGVDRRKVQPWITHNSRMIYEDGIRALGRYAKRRA